MASMVCINESLSDDEFRLFLSKLESNRDRLAFGLVCKRWLYLQSTETKAIRPYSPYMLRKLAARFPSVVDLRFVWHKEVKDLDLAVIAACFRCLKFLCLSGCRGITDAGIVKMKIRRRLSSLQHLNVSYCEGLTDKGLSAVVEGCCNLRKLHLDGCRNVTDKVLQVLSENCHNLEELGMEECSNITDSGLKSLVSGCQLINWLDISECRKITVVGIGLLLDKCRSLEYLDVMSCPHVTKAGCDEAGLQFPKCCRLRIRQGTKWRKGNYL